ncbi:hypothetical protein [Allobaculum sp. Allo2]|uniref:hypothetical protein n=1 Tax=Allobaculum sp. Allo2 TaxID=2853432 RepID=UPI001F6014A8|nr:hypothetical protein [Allobaculum sp. Allo2]UNT92564.1 hypothetical protein KWG61_10470 [Allobaculum sp. Allo2]
MMYILVGEDEARMQYKLEKIREKEKCEETVRIDAKADGEAALLFEMDTMNLFGTKTLLIVDNASFLGAKTILASIRQKSLNASRTIKLLFSSVIPKDRYP